MIYQEWLQYALAQISDRANSVVKALDVYLLLGRVCKLSRLEIMTHPDKELTSAELDELTIDLKRRLTGEPMAYILGQREFYGHEFKVTPATLIPRPDTELLVDLALMQCPSTKLKFADLGTGTGCIALSLALDRPVWLGWAIDISSEALAVAKFNAERLACTQIKFCQEDLREDLTPFLGADAGNLDLVVSNPPYVTSAEYETLALDVRNFEPKLALVPEGNPDGLDLLKAVARQATKLLRPGGLLLIEHGYQQAGAFSVWLKSHSWLKVKIHEDLAGHERVISARKPLEI